MKLIDRLNVYIQSLIKYVLSVIIVLAIGLLVGFVHRELGLLLIVSLITFVFIKYHYDMCKRLTSYLAILKWKVFTPLIIISVLLLTLKIYVNETINFNNSCFTRVSENARLWNYFLYSIWTSVILWELYYALLSKFLKNKLIIKCN